MTTRRRSDVPRWLVPLSMAILLIAIAILLVVLWIALNLYLDRSPFAAGPPATTQSTTSRPTPSGPPAVVTPLPTLAPVVRTDPQFDFPVEWAEVDGILDGDTIRLSDGLRVRYIGMDTPESETNPPECYAKEASAKNRRLVAGQRVALRRDKSETDRYGRLLRYVYLPDGRMVNEILVKEGYAVAAAFRPDVAFADRFSELEAQAKKAKRGQWKKC